MQAYDNQCPRRFGGTVPDTKRTEQSTECLGAVAKLRRATIKFVTSDCLPLSVCPSIRRPLGSHWTDLIKSNIWLCFEKSVENVQLSSKPPKKTRTLHEDQCTLMIPRLAQFFLEWLTFWTKIVEKIKRHIFVQYFFPWKSCRLWHNVEKYGTARQATDDNVAHVRFMLDN